MKIVIFSLLLAGWSSGITKEVVRIYQPVSYHDTDSATKYGVKGELVQAAVIAHPVVLSGAFPEDLIKAVEMPFRFGSNNSTYEVEEANLLVLCGIELEVERESDLVEVVIDCSQLAVPELVELSPQQILSMTVEAIRRTVRVYYQEGAYESFKCELRLQGLVKENQGLKKLETSFQVGPDSEEEALSGAEGKDGE